LKDTKIILSQRQVIHQWWFRTGDQGMIDAEGYLHLTDAASKELINPEAEKRLRRWNRRSSDDDPCDGGGSGVPACRIHLGRRSGRGRGC